MKPRHSAPGRSNAVLVRGAVAGALLAACASALSAQTPAPAPMQFCYVPLTGTVYRVGTPDTRPACSSTAHIPFSVTDGAGSIRANDPAGGDLSGTYPNPSVDGLQGRPVAATSPTVGQTLTWNGSAWEPSTAPAATPGVLGADPGRTYRVEAAGLLVNAGGVMAFAIPSYGSPSVTRTGVGEYQVSFPGYQAPIQPFFFYIVKGLPWSGHAPFPANGHPMVSVLNFLSNGMTLRVTDAQGAPMDLGIGRGIFIEIMRIN